MILLCNTFITETKPTVGKGFVFRENLKSYSNFDIFKYSLASLAVAHDWKKVLLFIELDPIYKHRQQELHDFIHNVFRNTDITLRFSRNYYQQEWKDTYDLLDDNLIWFYCNHDHIFIDSSRKYLNLLVDEMKDEELCSLAFSHWPENIRTAKLGGSSKPQDPKTYKIHDNYISYENESFDSIQIITKELYRRWWFEGEFNDVKLPRPDYFGIGLAEIKPVPVHKVIVPLKELCRHFDGYQHIPMQLGGPINNEQCPALEIPDGFFENNIKIHYGEGKFTENGWTNFDPLAKYYKAVNENGVDYKWTINDIPLCWVDRVSETFTETYINEELMIRCRLRSVLEMIYTNPSLKIDLEVEEKIIKLYLKDHPSYSI